MGVETAKPLRTLYVFAHQDDEVDVAAKIVTDLRKGAEVHCVWVTDGSHGGPADLREKESRAVMKFLGVPESNLRFLGFEDQNAYRFLREISRELIAVAEELQPAEITSQAYEGGNIDHDAVSFVSTLAAKKVNAVHYEFPDSNIYQGRVRVFEFLPDGKTPTLYTRVDRELYGIKMKTFKMYPTQATSLSSYELAMDGKSLKRLGEPYRLKPDYDYTQPPAAELRYAGTSKRTATLELWLAATRDFHAKYGSLE